MAAITPESGNQFRVKLDELSRGGFLGIGRRPLVQVDPYLIGRAIAEVMRSCAVRTAVGRPLLWNQYRVILSRADFEALRPLAASLDRDLREVMSNEAKSIGGDLVGALHLTVVVDEADELERGHAVVRTAFVPTEQLPQPVAAEMTVHVEAGAGAAGVDATIAVPEAGPSTGSRFALRWRGGSTTIAAGHVVVVGRPHPDAPGRFVPLHGASAKINKQHFMLATTPDSLTIARLPGANPVQVDGRPLAVGEQLTVAAPIRVSLSRDELVVEIAKA